MYQSDSVLKMYADNGLRSVEEWATLGRDIVSGTKPRLDVSHRGVLMSLYSRDQAHRRAPTPERI
jgi:hypothetical protein